MSTRHDDLAARLRQGEGMTASNSQPASPEGESPDPFAPSTKAVRIFAGLGILLLPLLCVVYFVIILSQVYSGDEASGPLAGVAPWFLGLSGIVGLIAMCMPGDDLSHSMRRKLVIAQYVLVVGGPALAAIDFG
ncbi:hypothetical protein [Streptomyces boluensis]|uniref:Uncharacterized protein n=1 Tax=Streptomyces boluensis TaxID=1775135 RepID=A0A964XQL8_9ACTN|nr:hypothetical protein [Streptomyces boluensis]NBE56421.1 hypothetical protein [Streptomyces boluensis]